MMGAIRRWYDTVTAQLASLTTALGNYLPLAGGTLTGTLSAPQYNINGVLFANGDGVTTHIYDGAGGTGLHLQAAINYYDADTHVFRNNTGSGNAAVVDASGNFTIGGNYVHFLASGGTVNTTGGPLLYADASNHVYKLGPGNGSWFFENYAGTVVASIGSAGNIVANGNITAPAFIGNVTGGTVTSTGNITAAGSITAGGLVSAQGYQTRAGTAGAFTGNYFNIEWRPGAHLWIDNVHQGTFVLDSGGGISTTSIYSSGGYTTRDPSGGSNFGIFSTGNYGYIRFLPTWYWEFNYTSPPDPGAGTMLWTADGIPFWAMRNSDGVCANYKGPVAGLGAYVNTSDRRGKKNITPSLYGLAEIMELTPVGFDRISSVDTPREIGFVAQDVINVLPEAVRVAGIPLPDGTGGLDDAEPTLGVADSIIVAALVNAVKELNTRLAALEGAG